MNQYLELKMPKKKTKTKARKLAHNKKVKMIPGGPTNQVGAQGIRYHKGYVYDKLRHTVLTSTMMSKEDRELVDATVKTINSGPEAMTLPKLSPREDESGMFRPPIGILAIGNGTQEGLDKPNRNMVSNGWACTEIGDHGKCYVLSYHGIEVSLFFKRQLTEIKLDPGDRQPEGVLQDPIDAWQKLDLLGASAKRANFVLTTTIRRQEDEIKLLESRVNTLQEYSGRLETELFKLQNSPRKKRKR